MSSAYYPLQDLEGSTPYPLLATQARGREDLRAIAVANEILGKSNPQNHS